MKEAPLQKLKRELSGDWKSMLGSEKKFKKARGKALQAMRAKDQVDLDTHDEGKGHKGNYK